MGVGGAAEGGIDLEAGDVGGMGSSGCILNGLGAVTQTDVANWTVGAEFNYRGKEKKKKRRNNIGMMSYIFILFFCGLFGKN